MRRPLGRARRSAVISVTAAVALIASLIVVQPFAGAATGQNGTAHNFSQVTCTAHIGTGTIQQKQDISVWAEAPDRVAPGEQFQVTFPSQPADLPSSAQGFTINSYRDLKTIYKVNGATVVASSGTTDGPAIINGNPTPAQTDTADPNLGPNIPGPLPPGHLVPPNSFAQVAAPAADGTITITAVEVDTTANTQGVGDVPVQCPVPANTLTTTQVGAGGPATTTTTVAGTTSTTKATTSTTMHATTTSTVPQGGGSSLVCSISGTATYKPGLTDSGGTATKAVTEKVTIKATMNGCTGGPPGLKAPVTNGTFSATGSQKIAKGAQLPSCSSWEAANFSVPMKSTSKLQNGKKTVATLAAPGPLGPLGRGSPVTFSEKGTVSTKGAFKGQPVTLNAATNVNEDGLTSTCHSSGGVTTLRFVGSSQYVIGTVPSPPETTTTTTSTSTTTPTTTASTTSSSTASTSTSTTASTTTTTVQQPVLPPEVRAALATACTTAASTLGPLGVDLTALTFGCTAIAAGQGSFLFQTFLISPQLGCALLAGQPVINNPLITAGCTAFAVAIQPFSSQIAPLIPQGFF